jgi:hypothetical protein
VAETERDLSMTNKTCGECRYYEHPAGQCSKVIEYNNCHITDKACEYFEPKLTNGDVIRQMSNEELAQKFGYPCPPKIKKKCRPFDEECFECWLAWLNAPAESEI